MTGTWLLASGSDANNVGPSYTSRVSLPLGSRAKNADSERSWLLILDNADPLSATGGSADLSTVRSVLDYYANLKVVYGDLKPNNLVVTVNPKPVLLDFDSFECSEYIQISDADFPLAYVAGIPTSPSTWLNAGQGNAPESTAPLSAQFNWPSIRQLAYLLAFEYPDTLAEDVMQNACYRVYRAIQDAHGPAATMPLEPASYVAVSGAFVSDVHQAFIRYIDGVITALSLLLVRVLTALARLSDFIDFILVIIAAFLHYGHRHEPGDDDSLPTRRNWTSPGSVFAIS